MMSEIYINTPQTDRHIYEHADVKTNGNIDRPKYIGTETQTCRQTVTHVHTQINEGGGSHTHTHTHVHTDKCKPRI